MILTDEEREALFNDSDLECYSSDDIEAACKFAAVVEREVLRKLREQQHAASISGQWRLSERGSLQRISNDGLTPLHIIPEEQP